MQPDYTYAGNELDVFYLARNWEAYWGAAIARYLGPEVLEVGAGIGANLELLCSPQQKRWVCLEPDKTLLTGLADRVKIHPYRNVIEMHCGTVASLPKNRAFDTVLYIDVLEHIEDDRAELEAASSLLRCGGFLVVLAPAHQRLYSPFDRSIGHYRRYSRRSLAAAGPHSLQAERLFYLDAAGLLASAANLLFLRQSLPTMQQIKFWDRWLVPLSGHLDRWCRFSVGKTVIGCWVKGPRHAQPGGADAG